MNQNTIKWGLVVIFHRIGKINIVNLMKIRPPAVWCCHRKQEVVEWFASQGDTETEIIPGFT